LALILLGGNSYETADYFEIGGDQVPTVMNVIGEKRKITSYSEASSKSSDRIIVEYSVDSDQGDEMEEYAQALMDDYDFVSVNGYDFSGKKGSDIQFAAISEEDDEFVVLVSIDYDSKGYTLTITRGEGTLSIGGPEEPPATEEPPEIPDDPVIEETPEPDEPDEPVVEDTPDPTPAPPPEGDMNVTCPGKLLGASIEAAQNKMPNGVTVIDMTAAGDFILQFPAENQQRLIVEAMADIEGVIMNIYNSHPGVDNIRWNGETFGLVYLVVNDKFLDSANEKASKDALLNIALYAPMVQVFQGEGLRTDVLFGYGDEDFENVLAEFHSPACIDQLLG